MLQDACDAVRSPQQTCDVQLVPILTRSDAFLQSNLDYFTPDVDGMYILGGDQTVAMGVVADTPFERDMAAAYADGVVVGGSSAGDAVQSVNMINGFTGDNGPAESMRQGAVDLWTSQGVQDPSRGLIFGLSSAIDEQHVYEQGRLGRAINVAMMSGLPVLGMDAATGGGLVNENTLTDVVGYTSAVVVDPVTESASSHYGGPNSTLSVRGIVTHLVPPGGFGYEIGALRPTVAGVAEEPPSIVNRTYPDFSTPSGSGSLFLSGGLVENPTGPAMSDFVAASGGGGARIVVVAAGYRRATDAAAASKSLTAALQPGVFAPISHIVLNGKTDVSKAIAKIQDSTGVFLTAPDASRVKSAMNAQPTVLGAIHSRWAGGAAALLADDAAAAVLGSTFVADPPPSADIDTESSEDFLVSGSTVKSGLGWVTGANVEPRLLPDRHWGHLYRLAWSRPSTLAVGIDAGTALRIDGGRAVAVGQSAAVVLDAREANLGTGSNGAMAARWVLLDSFVDGERLAP